MFFSLVLPTQTGTVAPALTEGEAKPMSPSAAAAGQRRGDDGAVVVGEVAREEAAQGAVGGDHLPRAGEEVLLGLRRLLDQHHALVQPPPAALLRRLPHGVEAAVGGAVASPLVVVAGLVRTGRSLSSCTTIIAWKRGTMSPPGWLARSLLLLGK
jgi:hypothetical protein